MMSYAGERKIIDADSHIIELDDLLLNLQIQKTVTSYRQ